VGGQDETRARTVLLAMQERLTGDPYLALGVAPTATAAEIRSAFLELTKTYHPARFGYMSPDVQKLSNEVFLSLRAAHDWIIRPARAAAAARADRSGAYPAPRSDRGSGPLPAVAGRSDRSGVFPAVAGRSDRSGVFPAVVPKDDRSGAFPVVAPKDDRSGAFPAVAGQSDRSGAFPAAPGTPAGSGAPARTTPLRLPSPPLAPAAERLRALTPPAGVRVGAMRPPGAPAATLPGPRPPPGGADRELAGVLEQLQRGQWEAARQTLAALAARAPDVPRYRALLSYARGREAQLAHRLDEARVELQDALQIDPELQLAKTALAELFTRRK
jgi:hypothetical protein